MQSTTNEVQCWPPTQEITEDDGTIKSCDLVLPEALYWDFIRPFTPVKDRAIINKRTGSTQFYAGDRIPLDRDYLLRFGESGKWYGGKRGRDPFQTSDCETFEITLPPRGECPGIVFDFDKHAEESSHIPILDSFHNDVVASQIPVRHHNASSWIIKIGDESLVGAAIKDISPADVAITALAAAQQVDTPTTVSVTLCSIQAASYDMPHIFEHFPYTEGEPGSSDFRLIFDKRALDRKVSIINPDEALVVLQKVRNTWDEHLSKIPNPSARLYACLDLFRENQTAFFAGNYWDRKQCPLLFHGSGSIYSLVAFHVSMNKLSIKGPPISRSLPNTQLGYWGGKYLCEYMEKERQGEDTNSSIFSSIIQSLASLGTDIEEFFEPMDEYPEETIVRGDLAVSNGIISVLSALKGCENIFDPDMGIIDCMKYYYHGNEDGGVDLGGLCGLIGCLEEHRKFDCSVLRFSVGDRVECFMDDDVWQSGTIVNQWYTDGYGFKQPYQIDLDNGITTTAPFDYDAVIRAPRPELRFSVGDPILCNMGELGWIEGTVSMLWWRTQAQTLKEITYYPYLVDVPDGREIFAMYDDDSCCRAPTVDEMS